MTIDDSRTFHQVSSSRNPLMYVIIPVFNESKNVERLCEGLSQLSTFVEHGYESTYIVVDDGSNDDTITCFNRQGLGDKFIMLQHKINRGPGAAFRTAFEFLAGRLQDNDLVLTMEGDNTSRLEVLSCMFDAMHQGAEVVLASPYAPGGEMAHVQWHRLFLSHAANILARWVLGLEGIYTLSSFYRLHTGQIIKRLQNRYGNQIVRSSGFECAVEMLLRLSQLNARIAEVPLKLDFATRKGKSKMRIMRTIKGYIRLFIQTRFN